MLSGIYNITCEQGSTFIRTIEIEYPDPSDPTTYLPFDLTGYSARMQVRRTVDSSATMISLTSAVGGGIEMQYAGSDNALRVSMTDEQTSTITSDGVYDLEIESSSGIVSRVIRGSFTLIPEVTR
jgi:hypothetical protein